MADLGTTSSEVVPGVGTFDTGPSSSLPLAGTINAGDAVGLDSSRNHARADSNDPLYNNVRGIAVNLAFPSQSVTVQLSGDITLGASAAMTQGIPYFLSSNAGKICPWADIPSGASIIQIGIARTTTVLAIQIHDPGIVKE